jgi:hypothetical protein
LVEFEQFGEEGEDECEGDLREVSFGLEEGGESEGIPDPAGGI